VDQLYPETTLYLLRHTTLVVVQGVIVVTVDFQYSGSLVLCAEQLSDTVQTMNKM